MSETLLETILESKPKTNLIAFFLATPERAFYVGELEKRVGSNLAPHLQSLVKMDLLKTFNKKSNRYYIINKKNLFLNDLRLALAKSLRYEDELIKALKKLNNLKVAVLTGVFTANPNMDCDILLAGDLNQRALGNFIAGAEKTIGQEVNYALFSAEEYQHRRNIFDRFTKDIFENPHIIVINKLK